MRRRNLTVLRAGAWRVRRGTPVIGRLTIKQVRRQLRLDHMAHYFARIPRAAARGALIRSGGVQRAAEEQPSFGSEGFKKRKKENPCSRKQTDANADTGTRRHARSRESITHGAPFCSSTGAVRRAETMTTATSPILLKWDPKNLEIRTLTVERLLEPLVTQGSLPVVVHLVGYIIQQLEGKGKAVGMGVTGQPINYSYSYFS
ncbi:catenin alpha-2 isoform X1 [Arapaima gigas]